MLFLRELNDFLETLSFDSEFVLVFEILQFKFGLFFEFNFYFYSKHYQVGRANGFGNLIYTSYRPVYKVEGTCNLEKPSYATIKNALSRSIFLLFRYSLDIHSSILIRSLKRINC